MSKDAAVRPDTSDPLSILIMTRDAIHLEIKHLEDQNAANLRAIEVKNEEIAELLIAIIVESRKGA